MAYTSTVANYKLGEKTDADWGSKHLGAQCSFPDLEYASTNTTQPTLSGTMLSARLVQHTGAVAVAPGSYVKYAVPGLTTASITAAGDAPAGVVDPYLTSSVAQNEYYWLVYHGPVDALAGAALALNATVIPDATGRGAAGTESVHYARMMEASAAAGEMKRVFLTCKG